MSNKLIYELIEHSLNNKVFKFDSPNEEELTKIIFENGLVGLLFEAIDKTSFKMQKYYQMLFKAFGSFLSKDLQQQVIIEQLKDIFNQKKIEHIFLKGTHLKSLYPKSYMRGMGDIDVIVKLDRFNDARKALEANNYKFTSATSHHHSYVSIEGIDVELHQSITSIVEYENKTFLKDIWNHVVQIDQYTYGLKHEFEYVYLLTHLVRHIRTSGVGIRSLLDIYIYEQAYKEVIDYHLLDQYLKASNLKVFNYKVKHLNHIFTNQSSPDGDDMNTINFITSSGIHGTGTEHDLYVSKRTHEQTRLKKSKFRFLLGEVFPSRARIQESYPYLKKHPYLLPWSWFIRLFKQFFKVKNTKKRLKAVTSDENVDRVKSVYDYLGL